MRISKRNKTEEGYCPDKIKGAISKAFDSVSSEISEEELQRLLYLQ